MQVFWIYKFTNFWFGILNCLVGMVQNNGMMTFENFRPYKENLK